MSYHLSLSSNRNISSSLAGAGAPAFTTGAVRLDLARFRKNARISLEDIAQETKISLRFLRAIEAEQFDQLPGGIFNTSYLRQYAAAVGYDEAELLEHYNQRMNPQDNAGAARRKPNDNQGFWDRWLKIPAEVRR